VTSDGICFSCDDCEFQETSACEDCLMSFVLGREPEDAIVVNVEEARAMRMLSRAGLVPELRHSAVDRDWTVHRDWAAS
jgi:predicted metal-binding protein